jgi:hypothetical protein
MAKTPPRAPPKEQAQIDAEINEGGPPTPLERMTELTRRIVQVPKSELPKQRRKVDRRKS